MRLQCGGILFLLGYIITATTDKTANSKSYTLNGIDMNVHNIQKCVHETLANLINIIYLLERSIQTVDAIQTGVYADSLPYLFMCLPINVR